MPLSITLELSDEDLAHFTRILDTVWASCFNQPERELIDSARAALAEACSTRLPSYVASRLNDIRDLLDLLDDTGDWPLEADERRRIVSAIAYFGARADLIPDPLPAIGYLDDALMADLVVRELEHDLAAYREFRDYRSNEATRDHNVSREEWLNAKRDHLMERVRMHRERMWARTRETNLTDPILRYKY